MSVRVMGAVWNVPMQALAKIVLLNLAEHAGADGTRAFPSIARIAAETCVAENTVRAKLRELEAAGFIARDEWPEEFGEVPTNRRPQCWRVVLDESGQCAGVWGAAVEPQSDEGGSGAGLDNDNVDNSRPCDGGERDSSWGSNLNPRADRGSNEGPLGFKSEPSGVQSSCTQTVSNRKEPSTRARAREAAAPKGAASRSPPADGIGDLDDAGPVEEQAPVSAHWRARREQIIRRFDQKTWDTWFAELVPESDDGATLVLAARSRFHADYIRQHHSRQLGLACDRRVEVVYRQWCKRKWEKTRPHD